VEDVVTLATAFMMTVSGFVEVALRAMLREQTISEVFSKEGDAEQIVGRERRERVSQLGSSGDA
jgi:hypothetical protein